MKFTFLFFIFKRSSIYYRCSNAEPHFTEEDLRLANSSWGGGWRSKSSLTVLVDVAGVQPQPCLSLAWSLKTAQACFCLTAELRGSGRLEGCKAKHLLSNSLQTSCRPLTYICLDSDMQWSGIGRLPVAATRILHTKHTSSLLLGLLLYTPILQESEAQ